MTNTKQFKRFILTGTPGSAKTSVIQELYKHKHTVILEAATDVIAIEQVNGNESPWEKLNFIDKIILMQNERQINAVRDLQFYDRSPFCTYALALYLSYPISPMLSLEIDRCLQNIVYQNQVFFFENLGFIKNTYARKISYDEALKFEQIHIDVYKKFGFEIVFVPKASVAERLAFILEKV
ncbi:MAG: AAA family ATPase [Alphaproteobacteria bacterium]|jgi:predicted ATPase